MARLAVLKKRHEEQMLLGAGHAGHANSPEVAASGRERDPAVDPHPHKLPPCGAAAEAGDAAADADSHGAVPPPAEAGWREVTAAGSKWGPLTLEEVRAEQASFSVARNWTQFHKPRNIMAALMAEVGELTEGLGLWREVGFGGEGLTPAEKHHVGEEITDCLVYLLRLADVLDVDLPAAVSQKMDKNRSKYPAELVYGSSKKYTEYKAVHRAGERG